MKPYNAQDIVKKLKARHRGEKVNITFRLSEKAIESFRKACEKQEVKPGEVIEELMLDFANSIQPG